MRLPRRRRLNVERSKAFTLVEALLATAIMGLAFSVLWDAQHVNSRAQVRVDREADLVSELCELSEALSQDTETSTHAVVGLSSLSLSGPRGELARYSGSPNGLVRLAGGRRREFGLLGSPRYAIEESKGQRVLFFRCDFLTAPAGRQEGLTLVRLLPQRKETP